MYIWTHFIWWPINPFIVPYLILLKGLMFWFYWKIQDVFTIVYDYKGLLVYQSQMVGGNVNLVVLPQHA